MFNEVQQQGLKTNKAVAFGTGFSVPANGTQVSLNLGVETNTVSAVNATVTLTAAQVAGGYVSSTSAAAVTMTMPTGTLLGAAVGAAQGSVMEFFVDNTAGANTVTVAVATNGILSDAANTTSGSFGQLTVASGATGLARFTIMFSSATAYVFTRTA
jgi:hypothetical protein